jgi:hypothetical protein
MRTSILVPAVALAAIGFVNRIMCEQMGAPYPPGYTPGMNDTPPG